MRIKHKDKPNKEPWKGGGCVGSFVHMGRCRRPSSSDSGGGLRGCEDSAMRVSREGHSGQKGSQCKGPEVGLGLAFTVHSKEASVARAE